MQRRRTFAQGGKMMNFLVLFLTQWQSIVVDEKFRAIEKFWHKFLNVAIACHDVIPGILNAVEESIR